MSDIIKQADTSKHVVLLRGGWSRERDVSLTKGAAVLAALEEAGYKVTCYDPANDLEECVRDITALKPDVVFNNLHGRWGEDGHFQAILNILGIPYTHSGVLASATAMDKVQSKKHCLTLGIPTADYQLISEDEAAKGDIKIARPYVIKPVSEGSSIDVRIIQVDENRNGFEGEVWSFGDHALIEEFIAGHELTVAVLDCKAQAVSEIVSQTRFFDYEAKYHDTRTRIVMPAEIPDDITEKCLEYSERIFESIGCRGLARCDFRYWPGHGVYFLEINTQPGLTPESIGPSQLVYNGHSFTELCIHLVETAKTDTIVKN